MGVQVDSIWTPFSRLHGALGSHQAFLGIHECLSAVLYKGRVFCCWTRYIQILPSTPQVCDQGQGDQPLWVSDACLQCWLRGAELDCRRGPEGSILRKAQ